MLKIDKSKISFFRQNVWFFSLKRSVTVLIWKIKITDFLENRFTVNNLKVTCRWCGCKNCWFRFHILYISCFGSLAGMFGKILFMYQPFYFFLHFVTVVFYKKRFPLSDNTLFCGGNLTGYLDGRREGVLIF